jgi:hypothetical protein
VYSLTGELPRELAVVPFRGGVVPAVGKEPEK